MKYLEIATPAVLPLGNCRFHQDGQERPALLVATLQHPPVQLATQGGASFSVTGPRAHVAHEYGSRFYHHYGLTPSDVIEIELAIPSLMGLGADSMLGLATAGALARLHGLPEGAHSLAEVAGLQASERLHVPAFDGGGLLVLAPPEDPTASWTVFQRVEVSHPERDAWAFVFYFPLPPDDVEESFESVRMEALYQAFRDPGEPGDPVAQLSPDTLPAMVASDDIRAFAELVVAAQPAGNDLISAAGPEGDQAAGSIFQIMEQGGALAWGQALCGFSLWCLVRGGDSSRRIRKAIQDHVGFFGGRVMATVIDNRGAKIVERPGKLGIGPGMRPRPGVSSQMDD